MGSVRRTNTRPPITAATKRLIVSPPARPGTPLLIVTEFKAGGSTFVKKLVDQWSADYKFKEGIEVRYDGVGSSAGIKGLTAGEYDFACSDAVLSDRALAEGREKGRQYIHVPLAMGAVVAAYNLPDVGTPLRFSGPLLADIYLGKVARWNDPAVQAENRQATLPDRAIKVMYRSDGSGTTSIWTEFLTKTSPAWAARMGTGTSFPKWPVGAGHAKNDGVTGARNAKRQIARGVLDRRT